MSQVLGVIDYVWRGVSYDAEKGSTVTLGGYKQDPIEVSGKTHHARVYEKSEASFTTVLKRGQKLSTLFAPGEGELQCNCDTGQSYIFPDAFVTNRPKMTGGEGGKIEVMFAAGSGWQELQNG